MCLSAWTLCNIMPEKYRDRWITGLFFVNNDKASVCQATVLVIRSKWWAKHNSAKTDNCSGDKMCSSTCYCEQEYLGKREHWNCCALHVCKYYFMVISRGNPKMLHWILRETKKKIKKVYYLTECTASKSWNFKEMYDKNTGIKDCLSVIAA